MTKIAVSGSTPKCHGSGTLVESTHPAEQELLVLALVGVRLLAELDFLRRLLQPRQPILERHLWRRNGTRNHLCTNAIVSYLMCSV
jgi:hypothetical protein